MEEKIILLLAEMKKELIQMRQEISGMKQKIIQLKQEMTHIKQEMSEKFDDVYEKMDEFKKEILDRQFVFEDGYGKKIDAIFEYVQFHPKTNLQRFEKIDDLEKRVSVLESKI